VAAQSLFADPKASQVGDVITVVLAERTAAQREAGWDNQSRSRFGGEPGLERRRRTLRSRRPVQQGSPGAQHIFAAGPPDRHLLCSNRRRDARGNLLVHGERSLTSTARRTSCVSADSSPFDIRHDNSVLSYQIADAEIEYRQAGMHRRFVRPGFLARAGAVVVLGAAIFFATN
jgi:flagellar L-ring protein FlgH